MGGASGADVGCPVKIGADVGSSVAMGEGVG